MDVLDQLGAVREGKLSRRKFTQGLLAAGVAMTTMPLAGRRAMASTGDQPTYFTWGGYDIPELFAPYQAKHGTLPNFAIFGGSEEALTKMRGGFVVDVSHPCNQAMPRWVATGLFQPVDPTRLSNWGDVMPELVALEGNEADGGNIWMVPFDWGQTSITYRTDLVEVEGEESWDILWDPKHAGRLGSLAAGADACWIGAIKAGVSFDQLNTE
jgi:spermidine/putrescine transport system substrate-binding protein